MDEFVTLDSDSASINFGIKSSFTIKRNAFFLKYCNSYDKLVTGLCVVQFGL